MGVIVLCASLVIFIAKITSPAQGNLPGIFCEVVAHASRPSTCEKAETFAILTSVMYSFFTYTLRVISAITLPLGALLFALFLITIFADETMSINTFLLYV